jgi:hypothetical protein
MNELRREANAPFFERRELQALLALYAEQVSCGAWRDYAIERNPRYSGFAVFRSSREWPLYLIVKFKPGTHARGDYGLFSGSNRIALESTLARVLVRLREHLVD